MATNDAKDNCLKPQPSFEESIEDLETAFDNFVDELTVIEEQIKEYDKYLQLQELKDKECQGNTDEDQIAYAKDVATTMMDLLEMDKFFKQEKRVREKYEELKKWVDAVDEAEEALIRRIISLQPLVAKRTAALSEKGTAIVRQFTELTIEARNSGLLPKPADKKEEPGLLPKPADKKEEPGLLPKPADKKEEERSEESKPETEESKF